jgi:mono/diheme cytochrome c family protein
VFHLRVQIKNVLVLLFVITLMTLPPSGSSARAQMMGSHMGPMMRGGGMRSMHDLMAWMNGAELKVRPAKPQPALDAIMRSLGDRLYGDHCAVCHGAKGDGNGSRSADLSPPPRDFTKGVYEFRSTPGGTLPTDEDLWKVISDGLHGTAMVPWISLSENERWALVAYIEGFSPRFATEARPILVAVPKPPPSSQELVEQGIKLYGQDCASCHGPKGEGNGPAVVSPAGPRGRPRDFTSGIFKRGSDLQDIYLTLRTGLDGTPMLSFANALTPAQTWALAAHVRTLIARPSQTAGTAPPMMGGGPNHQERLGMMIDMPGMAGMGMGSGMGMGMGSPQP